MPRRLAARPSERKKGAKSGDDVKNGLNLIRQGMSIRKASKECGVAYATLKRYHWKTVHAENIEGQRLEPNYSVNKVFTIEQERTLKEYFTHCALLFYGLTKRECRKVAYQCAVINNLKYPESWDVNNMAGKDWLQSFQRRNGVCAKKPETSSLARATAFNKHNVDLFFNNLENLVQRNPAFADGTRIFNLDETSTTTVQKPQKVIAPKGSKGISKVTSGERGTLVTTCCIIGASGNALPPVMVFPRKNFKDHMINNTPPGTLGLATPSGWMNNELFPSVMRHFIKHTNSTRENPSILIMDNHESHLSLEAIEMAKNSGVHILTLHPHTSAKLQPLDVGIYGPFKTYYNAALESWLMRHPGKPITIYNLGEVVTTAFQRSMTPTNIVHAFAKCGIFPFDRNIFTDIDFMPSTVTDRPCPECLPRLEPENTLSTSDTPTIDLVEPQESETTMTVDTPRETQSQSSQAVPLPSTSRIHTAKRSQPSKVVPPQPSTSGIHTAKRSQPSKVVPPQPSTPGIQMAKQSQTPQAVSSQPSTSGIQMAKQSQPSLAVSLQPSTLVIQKVKRSQPSDFLRAEEVTSPSLLTPMPSNEEGAAAKKQLCSQQVTTLSNLETSAVLGPASLQKLAFKALETFKQKEALNTQSIILEKTPQKETPMAVTAYHLVTPENSIVVPDHSVNPPAAQSEKKFISPFEFRDPIKAGPRTNNRKRRKPGRSMIATDTPEKLLLEEQKRSTANKKNAKKKKHSRKVLQSDDEDDEKEETVTYNDSDDDIDWGEGNNQDDSDQEQNLILTEKILERPLPRDPKEGEYVIVQLETKKQRSLYIGKVIEEKNENMEIYISFLRRKLGTEKFHLPNKPDLSLVRYENLKFILPMPTSVGTASRQFYSFGLDFSQLRVL